MGIKQLVEALDRNEFNANQIHSFDEFLCVHEGLNLMEHLAKREDAFALLDATLLRAAELLETPDQYNLKLKQIVFGKAYNKVIVALAKQQSLESIPIIFKNPDAAFKFRQRNSSTWGGAFAFFLQSLRTSATLQMIALSIQLQQLFSNCKSIEDLKNTVQKIEMLTQHPAFSEDFSGGIIEAARKQAQEEDEERHLLFKSAPNLLSVLLGSLRQIDSTKTPPQAKMIANEITALVIIAQFNNQSEKAFIERIESNILTYPTLPGLYTAIGPASQWVAKLSPQANMIILHSMIHRFNKKENRDFIQNMVFEIQNAISEVRHHKIVFEMSGASIEGEKELAQFLAYANLPWIKEIYFEVNESTAESLSSFIGSEKVRLKIKAGRIPELLEALTYSDSPIKCTILSDDPMQINQALSSHGFDNIECKPVNPTASTESPVLKSANFIVRKPVQKKQQAVVEGNNDGCKIM